MNQIVHFRRCGLVLGCLFLLCTGCDSTRYVRVEGKLLMDGQPCTVPAGQSLSLALRGTGDKGEEVVYTAQLQTGDGSFTFPGPQEKGIPAGKYVITLNQAPESTDPASLAAMAEVNQRFSAINDREIEISDEPDQNLKIDITRGTVTK